MARQDKKNKNVKKVATKPARVAGQPVLLKYARNDKAMMTPILALKAKKGSKEFLQYVIYDLLATFALEWAGYHSIQVAS